MNPEEWKRPDYFDPYRFDLSSTISSTTASGKKRSPGSYAPFVGGKRICLGKSLAEAQLKVTATYLTQHFDFEFVKPQQAQILTFPMMPRDENIYVILSKRN